MRVLNDEQAWKMLRCSCLQDQIITTYKQLNNILGESSSESYDQKVKNNWYVAVNINGKEFAAHIYDWKDSYSYHKGKQPPAGSSFKVIYGYSKDEPWEWHIGSETPEVAAVVKAELQKLLEEKHETA